MERNQINTLLGLTEKQLEEIAAPFEDGTWNRDEYGKPGVGRPTAFGEVMRPVTFKETPSVIAAMDKRAKELGASRSDYLRGLVAKDLAANV